MRSLMLKYAHAFVTMVTIFVCCCQCHDAAEMFGMYPTSTVDSILDLDPNGCAQETGVVEFRLPGCGCCGGCGCNATCENCGDPGGMFYPGAEEYMGRESRALHTIRRGPGGPDKLRGGPQGDGETCTPRRNCCTGTVRVTSLWVPDGCRTNYKNGPSTKLIPVYDDFDLHREKAVIYNDGMEWQVVFKDRMDDMPPPQSYIF